MDNVHHDIAEQLEGVLSGTVDLQAVLDNWPRGDGPLSHCYANLHHFLFDAHTRAKHPEYRAMQESEMRKLIRLLRSNGDPSLLKEVHFLGASKVT